MSTVTASAERARRARYIAALILWIGRNCE